MPVISELTNQNKPEEDSLLTRANRYVTLVDVWTDQVPCLHDDR